MAARPVQSQSWSDAAHIVDLVQQVVGKIPNLTQPINDPALNNRIAVLRGSSPNWLNRVFSSIGEWMSANKDTLLDLGFGALKMLPSLLLDP